MEFAKLHALVRQQVAEHGSNDNALLGLEEREAVRRWKRRLSRVGNDPGRLKPRAGSLEWLPGSSATEQR
jgi:hypothetical protein